MRSATRGGGTSTPRRPRPLDRSGGVGGPPDALGPTAGSWDDLSIWTGSTVLGTDGTWRMYYTATNSRGHGVRDQRIGLAESDDLVTCARSGAARS